MSVPVPANPSEGAQQAHQVANQTGPKGAASDINASTRISSVQDLKQKAPDLYNETMKSIAWTIVRQVRRSQRRLEKIQREARRQNK